jgi:c-di-GMP-related signal transduction protein
MGYTIALDDFFEQPGYGAMVDLADVIKIDFLSMDINQMYALLKKLQKRNRKIRFLAEKIETNQEFVSAEGIGFTLFQGYFFVNPRSLPPVPSHP